MIKTLRGRSKVGWAVIIVVLPLVSALPLCLGLAITLPVLGHTSDISITVSSHLPHRLVFARVRTKMSGPRSARRA